MEGAADSSNGYSDRKQAKLEPWFPKRGNPNFAWLSHYVRISTDSNSAHFVLTCLVFALAGIERKERRPTRPCTQPPATFTRGSADEA